VLFWLLVFWCLPCLNLIPALFRRKSRFQGVLAPICWITALGVRLRSRWLRRPITGEAKASFPDLSWRGNQTHLSLQRMASNLHVGCQLTSPVITKTGCSNTLWITMWGHFEPRILCSYSLPPFTPACEGLPVSKSGRTMELLLIPIPLWFNQDIRHPLSCQAFSQVFTARLAL
jgi:hypothetical protein